MILINYYDAQKLTYDHVVKADDILEQPFINNKKKVYGMFLRSWRKRSNKCPILRY